MVKSLRIAVCCGAILTIATASWFFGTVLQIEKRVNTRWQQEIRSGTNRCAALLPQGVYRAICSLRPSIPIQSDAIFAHEFSGNLQITSEILSNSHDFVIRNPDWRADFVFTFTISNRVENVNIVCIAELDRKTNRNAIAFLVIRSLQ